jgi:hypothetical protein
VPEHSDGESPVWVLHGLGGLVIGIAGDGQAPRGIEPLMVVRRDADPVAEDSVHLAARLQPHIVQPVDPRRGAVAVVPDDVGQMLGQGTAADDRQQLHAPADAQQRKVPVQRRAHEGQLRCVPLGPQPGRLRVRLLAVQLRVEVGTSGEHDSVQALEDRVVRRGRRWQDHCPAAGGFDAFDVAEGQHHGGQVPHAPARLLDVRRDADHRPSPVCFTRHVHMLAYGRGARESGHAGHG